MNLIETAIADAGGLSAFTSKLNQYLPKPITYQAVRKWAAQGRLPRTDWTGETDYAGAIERVTDGRLTKKDLLTLPSRSKSGIELTSQSEPACSVTEI